MQHQNISLRIEDILNVVKSQFNVIQVIDLDNYAHRPYKLYEDLIPFKKESYNANDRLIFNFFDTDYYHVHGFTLYNLQKILLKLNIPNFFCIILTNQGYVKTDAQKINSLLDADSCPISVFNVFMDLAVEIENLPPTELNFDSIVKPYLFLSRRLRKHRMLFFSLLEKNNILNNGHVSSEWLTQDFISPSEILQNYTNNYTNNRSGLNFLATQPWSRCNEDWPITDQELFKIYDNLYKQENLREFPFKNFDETVYQHSFNYKCNRWMNIPLYQSSFLNVAAETMFHYPGTFLTEKSFLGILSKRPFVMLGPKNNLSELKSYGFKTFDAWWDESYDEIECDSERLKAVFSIVYEISQKSLVEIVCLAKEMTNVLEYNFNYLIHNFSSNQLAQLTKQCIINKQCLK